MSIALDAEGAMLGLLGGAGLVLISLALTAPTPAPRRRSRGVRRSSGVGRSLALGLTGALVAALVVLAVAPIPVVALIAAVFGGLVPELVRRRRRARSQRAIRQAWPDAVDHLLACVRTGLALPESVAELGRSGPLPLRRPFAQFADDVRVSGAFAPSLDVLQARLADPVGDRVCAALRVARETGGTDLGRVLDTLATMLREHDRIRGEVEGRQSWTVTAARLAVGAPWLTLALLCTRPEAAQAYSSPAGTVVLLLVAVLCAVAYVVMRRIGRLPADERLTP